MIVGVVLGLLIPHIPVGFTVPRAETVQMLFAVGAGLLTSPAINDPTTASQVLDSVESLLRTLVGRDLDVGVVTGPRGSARVLLPLPGWDDYVSLSFDELIEMGAGHAQVRRRLERVLTDLSALAPQSRRAPLQLRLDRLAGRPSERVHEGSRAAW